MTRTKKIGLAAACAMVLLLGVLGGWWLRGPSKGTKEMLNFFEALAPKPSTNADWKNLAVEKTTVKISDFDMPIVAVKNVRPLMEAEADTSAHHLAVLNTRNQNELNSVIWSHKANKALEFDWSRDAVKFAEGTRKDSNYYLGMEAVPARNKYNYKYSIGTPGTKTSKRILSILTPAGERKLPWERQTSLQVAYYFRNYRYAICLERSNDSGKIQGMVIIDLDKLEVAGIVSMPLQVGPYAPLLLLDPTTDLLICCDIDLAWIVCVDFRQGIDQPNKPWPPPWPHPALGPWHGNHDIMSGRDSQLSEGATPPPKPSDYP